ncbi:MAG TPA: carboxypeptidase regulatory-like domain-containing protein [Pyrinomonadaceae bacterium]|nr:carboxypeptidase regulatory-like domain-containing protein [Pyrinomonadaceae bacterium]
MSFSTRYASAVLITVFSLAITVSGQSANTQVAKSPRGSVSGRVTIKDKPAVGVAVSLRKGDMMNPWEQYLKGTTDQDGFYRIANVPPGSYEVAPAAPAFVSADTQRGKNVVVGEDENVEGVNFSLIRGGVITGKITDADGRPVIQQQVNLFLAEAFAQAQQQQQPVRQIFPASNTQTDDRGIYRIYGLRAGCYKVATGRSDDVFTAGFNQTRATYKQVFHPDVTEQAKATIIEVTEGSEAANVDIRLGATLQTFSVSGRIVDAEGLPKPNIHFAVQRISGQRGEFINPPLTSNAQGEFYTEGLVPGKYQVYLFQEMNGDLRAEGVTFDILDQDVSNVMIKLTRGASLSGVVVLESEDKAALQKLLTMRLLGHVPTTGGAAFFNQSSSSTISPDGSFRLGGLPAGSAVVQLQSMMGPFDLKGFAISRIERDGVVLPRGIELREGEHIGGLRVVVAYGNGSIRGVVKVENGTIPAGGQMYVRLAKPGDNNYSGLRPGPVDSRGQFLMEGIPPGTYEVAVTIFGMRTTPSTAAKREVNVQDGVVTDVVLTVDVSTLQAPTPPKP